MKHSHRETEIESDYLSQILEARQKATGKAQKRSKLYHEALGFWMRLKDILKLQDDRHAQIIIQNERSIELLEQLTVDQRTMLVHLTREVATLRAEVSQLKQQ